ncbi:DUF3140 domain-containing protein [Actinophytocola gossypii]|uniref:DUF3140 domain-containing protein n=1 Tax=Actinophytocola gossypii TaxID=2812003 RepID=A0ABT2JJ41_9PSEU|nr:DUF3140 domain-containing protein [Actinophytocola gossypii]MCT2587763.1 DUF3140 domain-containing protein [Actinophytocola gossypii]
MDSDERERVREEFDDAVNLTAKQLEQWLDTDESKSVGDKREGEAIGHESGRRIVSLLRTRRDDLTDDDYDHMRTVVGYVHRHLAQRPDKPDSEIEGSRWRHSLMNWGHDPLRT